jgi:hypothetical protein
MNTYDYLANVKSDIFDYILEKYSSANEFLSLCNSDPEGVEEELEDELWTADSVTGNGTGSYTMSSLKASQNLVGNWGLIQDVIDEFGLPEKDKIADPEFWDVSIRCYLLSDALGEVIKFIKRHYTPSGELKDDEDEDL